MYVTRTPDHSVKVNSTWILTASTLMHRLVLLSVCFIYPMSGRYTQCPGDTVKTETGKVDPASKFKWTTEARGQVIHDFAPKLINYFSCNISIYLSTHLTIYLNFIFYLFIYLSICIYISGIYNGTINSFKNLL